ncbi:MAG TPA: tail fiber protein [Telluria sp.]|nr:tail fiber protein [Telluria sp.]
MSEQYLGEIRINAMPFAPRGWASCNGQLLAINQNQALFSLLGTTYGGDGRTNFALPDLRGRVPMHDTPPGQRDGHTSHTLLASEMPNHTHLIAADKGTATVASPAGAMLGNVPAGGTNLFHPPDGSAAMDPSTVANAGGNQPHENMQPYLALNFVIAVTGIFPSQN